MLIKQLSVNDPYNNLHTRQVARMRQVAERSLTKVTTVSRTTSQIDGEGGLTTPVYTTVHSTVGRAERLKEPYEVLKDGRLVHKAHWRILIPVDVQVLPGDRIACGGLLVNVVGTSVHATSDVYEEPAAAGTAIAIQEVFGEEFGDFPNY